jgi:hypothetical protein
MKHSPAVMMLALVVQVCSACKDAGECACTRQMIVNFAMALQGLQDAITQQHESLPLRNIMRACGSRD